MDKAIFVVDVLENWNMSQKSSPYSWLLAHKGKWKSATFSDTLLIRFCWCTSSKQSRNLRCQSWSQHFYLKLLGCFVSSCPLSLNIHCKVPLGISVFWHRHTKPISTCLEVRACYYVILHSFCVQLRSWRSSQGSQLNLISLGKVPASRSIVPIDSWQRSYICLASSGLSCGQLGKRHL